MADMTENAQHDPIEICLALGSNLGDRLSFLRKAKEALEPYMTMTAASALYETEPAYAFDQPLFMNAALRCVTKLDPLALLYTVKDIELEIGRTPTYRYGPRVIDIDIIFYGDRKIQLPDLIIPHALMAERDFVLLPLADVAGDWMHPVLNKTVSQLLSELSSVGKVNKFKETL